MTNLLKRAVLVFVALVFCGALAAAPAIATPHSNPGNYSHGYEFLAVPSSGLLLGSIFGGLFAGSRPTNLGASDGTLKSCPSSPNCVSSKDTDGEHAIAPFTFTGSGDEVFAALVTIVKQQENATVITEEANYLYAEFQSPLMGFVDDVEFLLNQDDQVIHVRSASRLGQSDLGVNRKRVESIRAELNQAIA